MDDYIGSIEIYSGATVPAGFLPCEGQVLSITDKLYIALFAVIGYQYNPSLNGTGTFQLPDYRGRVAIGSGTSVSGTTYAVGQTGGSEQGVIGAANMPAHNHEMDGTVSMLSSPVPGNVYSPAGAYYSSGPIFSSASDGSGSIAEDFTIGLNSGAAGNGTPYDNRQPYLPLNYMISYQGIFPMPGPADNDIVGMIIPYAGSSVPSGYLLCDGTSYSTSNYAALGAIIGADSSGNFSVPNLIGHAAMGTVTLGHPGQATGSETTVLNTDNVINHMHSMSAHIQLDCNTGPGNTADPTSTFPAAMASGYTDAGALPMGSFEYDLTVADAGAATVAPIDNRSPFLAMRYIICCVGWYIGPNS